MDKFWIWMEKKTGYNEKSWKDHNKENSDVNLIGRMVDYCIINKIDLILTIDINAVIVLYTFLETKINEKN